MSKHSQELDRVIDLLWRFTKASDPASLQAEAEALIEELTGDEYE